MDCLSLTARGSRATKYVVNEISGAAEKERSSRELRMKGLADEVIGQVIDYYLALEDLVAEQLSYQSSSAFPGGRVLRLPFFQTQIFQLAAVERALSRNNGQAGPLVNTSNSSSYSNSAPSKMPAEQSQTPES